MRHDIGLAEDDATDTLAHVGEAHREALDIGDHGRRVIARCARRSIRDLWIQDAFSFAFAGFAFGAGLIGTAAAAMSTPARDAAFAPSPAAIPATSGPGTLPFCGDFDMRIARDGTWFYHGSPIGRKPLVKLFASVLRRETDGSYWLVTPFERGRIAVDDAPFLAVELTVEGSGSDQILVLRTNLDETVAIAPERPLRVAEDAATGEPSPYVLVRAGRDGRPGLEALIARPVFYQLVELAVADPADPERLGVWSKGAFFALGRT
jgi:hypothetical protein